MTMTMKAGAGSSSTLPHILVSSVMLLAFHPAAMLSQTRRELTEMFNQRHMQSANSTSKFDTIFVNFNDGIDTSDCGSKTKPCRTFSFSWKIAKKAQSSGILFIIAEGRYFGDTIEMNCKGDDSVVNNIIIRGKSNNSLAPPIFGHSLSVRECSVHIERIKILQLLKPVFYQLFFTDLTMMDIHIENVQYSIYSESSNVTLNNTKVTNCTSVLPKQIPLIASKSTFLQRNTLVLRNVVIELNKSPFLLTDGLYFLDMDSVNISSNSNSRMPKLEENLFSSIQMLSTKGVILTNIIMSQNIDLRIVVDRSNNVTMDEIKVEQNQGSHMEELLYVRDSSLDIRNSYVNENVYNESQYLIFLAEKAKLALKHTSFNCNRLNGSLFNTPIHFKDASQVNVSSCTAASCQVKCHPGEYIKNELLCIKCKPGHYSVQLGNFSTKQCSRCPSGTFSSASGSSSCRLCESGTFCRFPGCTKCSKCEDDFLTSRRGASSCSELTILFSVLIGVVIVLIGGPAVFLVSKKSSCTRNKSKRSETGLDSGQANCCINSLKSEHSLKSDDTEKLIVS